MQTQQTHGHGLDEQARYFRASGTHLYTVLHRVEQPIARVLLVGPIPSERHYSYVPWVSWARFLAERNVEVLRYDHRGIGESEGVFEELSFVDWTEDLHRVAGWFRRQSPELPLVLHGLEIGALLVAAAFHEGMGDLLLLWAPPKSANESLRSALLRWIALDQISKHSEERRPASAVIRGLEEGCSVEVAGYRWSSRFWHDSFAWKLTPDVVPVANTSPSDMRPVKVFPLGKEAAPLIKAGYLPDEERKDFNWLFAQNWEWLESTLGQHRKADQ